jgi:capsular polysaccharide biosynthesis protein
MDNESLDDEIDLLELLKVLLNKIWLIIIVTVLCAAAAFGITAGLIRPKYTASTLLYVNNSNLSVGSASFSISNADLSAAQKLVDTYVVILTSRRVLNDVIAEAGVNYTYEELCDLIKAEAVNNTEVFEVEVTTHSPQESELIANTIARVLPDKIAEVVNGSDVKIVDYAVIPAKKSSPSFTKNTAIGALAGFVIVCAVIVVRYLLDDSIQTEDYLTETYPDIPLLAVIPDLSNSKKSGYGYYSYGRPNNVREAKKNG